MQVTLQDLVVPLSPDQLSNLLSDWQWLVGADVSPCLVTSAGDVFFADAGGSVRVLDIEEASHEVVAESMQAFKAGLSDQAKAHAWLGVDRYVRWRRADVDLPKGCFYSFTKPLCLGGEDSEDNIEATDPTVTISILGQIHDQIRSLPEGAPISDIRLR